MQSYPDDYKDMTMTNTCLKNQRIIHESKLIEFIETHPPSYQKADIPLHILPLQLVLSL